MVECGCERPSTHHRTAALFLDDLSSSQPQLPEQTPPNTLAGSTGSRLRFPRLGGNDEALRRPKRETLLISGQATIPSTSKVLTVIPAEVCGLGGNDSLGLTGFPGNTSTPERRFWSTTPSHVSQGVGDLLHRWLGQRQLVLLRHNPRELQPSYGGNLSDAYFCSTATTPFWISGTASSSGAHGSGGNDTIYVGGTALSSFFTVVSGTRRHCQLLDPSVTRSCPAIPGNGDDDDFTTVAHRFHHLRWRWFPGRHLS